MKNTMKWLIPVMIGVGLALYFSIASAGGLLPEGVTPTLSLLDVHGKEVKHWVWTFEVDGATCVVVDGTVECFCSCAEPWCNPKEPTVIPSTKEPTPEPTKKPKCNRGLGNGSEGCDPGNSGGKPGSAGEGNE